eukprot:scaffold13128_cov76-Phaeocystis_antarctica.AAC.1
MPPPCEPREARSSSIGAMDESSRTVEKASTHSQPDSSRRWCWSASPCHTQQVLHPARKERARNVPSGRWMKCHGRFKK